MFAVVADWCGHCRTLKATVPQSQLLMPFDFFYMNGDKTQEHRDKTERMGVHGFPTIYYINRDGVLQEYTGGRSANDLARVFHKKVSI